MNVSHIPATSLPLLTPAFSPPPPPVSVTCLLVYLWIQSLVVWTLKFLRMIDCDSTNIQNLGVTGGEIVALDCNCSLGYIIIVWTYRKVYNPEQIIWYHQIGICMVFYSITVDNFLAPWKPFWRFKGVLKPRECTTEEDYTRAQDHT